MKMTDIERDPITTVLEWSEPCVSLAAEAQEVLGYKVLQAAQQETEKGSALQLALAKAGIEVLNATQVQTYQTEMLKERTTELFNQWLLNPSGTFFGPGWNKTKIADYKQPVPEFVLNKAVQIKRLLPEVRIYIQHLTDHPDPFLVVATKHKDYECLDAEEFYIEVWEEPKFEGRLR
jgi:hypothetical protein